MAADDQPLGLYVHVPFCEATCTYCHFAIDPRRPDEAREERYLRALLAEMDAAVPGPADTLYFGGGTPSLMAAERLARIVDVARSRFALAPHAEITLEANPRDLDRVGYCALRALGVNRISLGVQSLNADALREMGRLHTPEDARHALSDARAAGFDNVSVDVILGWPGETRERWSRTVDGVLAAAPEHVSLYVLEVEGKTLLTHQQRQGQLVLPEDDLVADLYAWTVERLCEAGIERYEVSNFARPGLESRHNGRYWDDAPFLGFACRRTATATDAGGGTTRPTASTVARWSRVAAQPPCRANAGSIRTSVWPRPRSRACGGAKGSTWPRSARATARTCWSGTARHCTSRSRPR